VIASHDITRESSNADRVQWPEGWRNRRHDPPYQPGTDWSLGDNNPKAAAITLPHLCAEWSDQTILIIGTHFAAPTAGHVVRDCAAFSLRCEGGEFRSAAVDAVTKVQA
jgi:hypothetical protein